MAVGRKNTQAHETPEIPSSAELLAMISGSDEKVLRNISQFQQVGSSGLNQKMKLLSEKKKW